MTEKRERCGSPFKLRPYASTGNCQGLILGGLVCRFPGTLCIEYQLEGDLLPVVFPAASPVISRRHELWRQTCFELFFGVPGDPQYWEVNFAPDGCWNLYHFTGYRQGMSEEAAAAKPTCNTVRECQKFSLFCRIDIHKLVPDNAPLEVGIAGVVLDASGITAYWAIDHCEAAPNFHSRSSFLMHLPGVA